MNMLKVQHINLFHMNKAFRDLWPLSNITYITIQNVCTFEAAYTQSRRKLHLTTCHKILFLPHSNNSSYSQVLLQQVL